MHRQKVYFQLVQGLDKLITHNIQDQRKDRLTEMHLQIRLGYT